MTKDPVPSIGDVFRSLAFYVAFYGGTALYVITALIALIFGREAFIAVVHAWSRFHRRCVSGLLGIRVVMEGAPPRHGALIALKHESFFEAIDLPNLLHRPAIIAKAELLRIPLWGRVGGLYGLVPVEREQGARALRTMLSTARALTGEGRVLAIFPEGTRVPHGTRRPLQPGFAGLYKVLGLPVTPIAVDSGACYHRRWKRRGTINIRICEPIPPGLPRDEMETRVLAAINALNP
jgi:1-acyl-sn-glycerol-3-phosphate acyltransferase